MKFSEEQMLRGIRYVRDSSGKPPVSVVPLAKQEVPNQGLQRIARALAWAGLPVGQSQGNAQKKHWKHREPADEGSTAFVWGSKG